MTKHNFPDFTRNADFDVLMREFQQHRDIASDAKHEADVAQLQFQMKREYWELCDDYLELFSAMMKKLLDCKTTDDIHRVRETFNKRLVPLVQKLNLVQSKLNNEIDTVTLTSRDNINDQMSKVQQLLDAANKLKNAATGKNDSAITPTEVIA
jgi:DUF438 domain-containing protein